MKTRDLLPDDATWPPGLADLGATFFPTPPRVLGPLPDAKRPAVAIVGSREASDAALEFARKLASRLAKRGVVIWSGGAIGIDRAAHEGALDAGGTTVAVLGGGIGRPSPPCHVDLFRTIVERGGALVSPYPDEHLPLPQGFLHRNKVLAAASQGLVVVECDLKSGARAAAAAARSLRRPVGVVPYAPWDARGSGNRHELTSLRATPIASERDVLRLLGVKVEALDATEEEPAPAALPAAVARLEDPLAREIHALLAASSRHVDEIGAATKRTTSEVSRALFELAVEDLASEVGAGNWALR